MANECAKCGVTVHVEDGHEFLEGDLCCCCLADENERLTEENAALDAQVERLSAPLNSDEYRAHVVSPKAFEAIIAARANAPQPKELK